MSITLENLRVSYGKNVVLNELSLQLQRNQIHGLVGLNGAGKTTLFNAISGMKKAEKGKFLVEGQEAESGMFGYLQTENFFYPKIKGREYLGLFQKEGSGFKVEEWNELFELPLNRYVEDYSTGMKKKLAFMAVISLDRPYLLLDEPFNGVDFESNQKIRWVVERLAEKGKTVLISSHILEALKGICHTIAVLFEGKIAFQSQSGQFEEVQQFLEKQINQKSRDIIGKILK